jgi:A/G-specific adenine glycosylase
VRRTRNGKYKASDRKLVNALCAWFEREKRNLPWRRRRSGYTALVAEAMLQQTQVARVSEYFRKFIRRFPTVKVLAAADAQEVLALWQGLGYYRRARNLHAAAKIIAEEHNGRVPRNADALRALPGVGRYTANAIASIVYKQPKPIVDGNVRRVLARWHGKNLTVNESWERAEALVKLAEDPGTFNEGLMELGAVVCTPKAPRCSSCAVSKLCEARRRGVEERVPMARPGIRRKVVHHHGMVVARNGKILLEQRPDNGLWSSMWQVPTVEAERVLRPAELRRRLGIRVETFGKRGQFEHGTTHRHITFHVYTATSRARSGTWRRLDNVADLPMSNAQRRVLDVARGPCPSSESPKGSHI